ncbi:uncharacterized protein [Mycetomoellerius zeteki]|uniref:uncharacterized protein n=1 Tax=Mycetomoellerius zeteki TaxID=64791 RepID=UPI00084E460F|nr:PREDICTED: uncharacterized protein LOC108731515 [Trachymyrmex zeteki]
MDSLRSQITIQMNRFLMIQNAAEDASEDVSNARSRHLVSTRLEILEANWAKFQTAHELCQMSLENLHEEAYIKHRTYERCQEFYIQARATLLEQQETVDASNSSSRRSDTIIPEARPGGFRMRLPKINLPSFAGDYNAWRSFHDLFTTMVVDNNDLMNVERMHYLKTCLKGDAARLVTNLKVTDDTFFIAWKTLVTRYENKRMLISAQLDKLFGLKPIKSRSAKELNTILATVTAALGALEALDCNTSSWDPFLVYLVARLLDADTREAWEVRLDPSMSYPTFKEFEEFLTGHTRAWKSLTSTLVKPSKEKSRSSWPLTKPEATRCTNKFPGFFDQ